MDFFAKFCGMLGRNNISNSSHFRGLLLHFTVFKHICICIYIRIIYMTYIYMDNWVYSQCSHSLCNIFLDLFFELVTLIISPKWAIIMSFILNSFLKNFTARAFSIVTSDFYELFNDKRKMNSTAFI